MKRLVNPLNSHHPFRATIPALVAALALIGCDGDSPPAMLAGDVTADTSNNPGADTTTPDTTGVDTTLIDPDIRCDRRNFDIQNQSVSVRDGVTRYAASNAAAAPADVLSIEIYAGGQFSGATGPGTYKLDDPNYATCSNCVLIGANCTAEDGCQKTFYADVGSLRLDAYDPTGGAFTGRLQGLVLREVTIDRESFESTVVAGGETWCINDYEFASEIKGLPVSDRTQPTCVAEGTGVYLEDNIKNVTWTNCLGEEVQLHDVCGQKKAMWLIATAGWCSACKDFIATLVAEHGGSLSREKVGAQSAGLDMLIVLGENNQQAKPTLQYCMQYATQSNLDPAMVVMDWTDAETQIPLVDPEGYAVGMNSLGITWASINPYLTADEEGSVASGYPWWGLLDARNMSYVWSDYAQRGSFSDALTALLSAP